MKHSPHTTQAEGPQTLTTLVDTVRSSSVEAGIGDPFVGFEDDPTRMDEKTFMGRAIELAGRDPTSLADFGRILDFGIATGHFDAAKEAVGTYAYDLDYPQRKLALQALSPYEQAANMLLTQMNQAEEAERLEQMRQMVPGHPIVRGCCADGSMS